MTTNSIRTSENQHLNLSALHWKMKSDPESYEMEIQLLYNRFNSCVELFALNMNSVGADPQVAKDLTESALFLAHMAPFHPHLLSLFPNQLSEFLRTSARSLPSPVRLQLSQALILLINDKVVDLKELLSLFMELQTLGDKGLREQAFSHVIHCIGHMNHDQLESGPLQRILISMLERGEESLANRALIVLCDLHMGRIWFDKNTAVAICRACLNDSPKIMKAALRFLLSYEKFEDVDDYRDTSNNEDEHTGTTSGKKKKKEKAKRFAHSMKRIASERSGLSYYSPLDHLIDAEKFAEDLFKRLQTCNERFEVKTMLLKVIARTIWLHRVSLPNFYSFLQNYVQPHQLDILAAAVQACHDRVPPNAVEHLFKQIVNQFVNDRSRSETVVVGLDVVREICLRMPLLMKEDFFQDLVLYKTKYGKAVSSAARSLVTLFRELNDASNGPFSDEDHDGDLDIENETEDDFAASTSEEDDDLTSDSDSAQSEDEMLVSDDRRGGKR